jgi:hypothetical protein
MRNSPSEIALTDADRQYQAPPPPLVYENNGVAAAVIYLTHKQGCVTFGPP